MPYTAASNQCCGKAVLNQCWHKDHWPLHAFSLMDGHDTYGVGVCVQVVLPALGICIFGSVLEEISKRGVLLGGLRMEVDRLKVRNNLAEFAQIVEDDLTPTAWKQFLAKTSLLKEGEKHALDRILSP